MSQIPFNRSKAVFLNTNSQQNEIESRIFYSQKTHYG